MPSGLGAGVVEAAWGSDMPVLKVRNWAKYQHYRDRCPPWIKLATDTFQNYEFSRLHDASKLLAVCIWTIASRSKDGAVPDDFAFLKAQGCLGDLVKDKHLEELISKGFLERSNALAGCEHGASPEAERETETKGEAEQRQSARVDDFDRFWIAFPKKKSKGDAEKAWRAMKPPIGAVLAALSWQAPSVDWTKENRRYVPYPATYLRDRGWEDEPTAPTSNGRTAKTQATVVVATQWLEKHGELP